MNAESLMTRKLIDRYKRGMYMFTFLQVHRPAIKICYKYAFQE